MIDGYNDGYKWTSPEGSFDANANGLYDMGGNVREWCEDQYEPSAPRRVLRGASWFNNFPGHLLSSYRLINPPGYRLDLSGFRCILSR